MKNCNQCGKCCIKYSDGGLVATQEEIDFWEDNRPEIAQYVYNNKIWRDPDSHQQLTLCPFLEKLAEPNKYGCGIYTDRPDDCKHYPVTIDQMRIDSCEMLEDHDLINTKQAQEKLDFIMMDSRPPYGG